MEYSHLRLTQLRLKRHQAGTAKAGLASLLRALAMHSLAVRVLAASLLALGLGLVFTATASAQIFIDGNITEPEWELLGDNLGGPAPPVGPGNEINALYAYIDSQYFYLGVAGNVRNGQRILVFIDSRQGGYSSGNFSRDNAPAGLDYFNASSTFDADFLPDYALVIGTNAGQTSFTWDLYTLSGVGNPSNGSPNLPLGDNFTNPNLGANPILVDGSLTNGFETRLTYSESGAGANVIFDQGYIKLFAMYISDAGYLSNQFIPHATMPTSLGPGPVDFGPPSQPGPVTFASFLVVNEVDFAHPGNDREFVEIKNTTNHWLNLGQYDLHLVNGSGPGLSINTIALPPFNIGPNQYYVVCGTPANVPGCNQTVSPNIDFLSNALPSAVALAYRSTGTVIDTVSYGGNTGGPYTEGAGVWPVPDGNTPNLGISRIPDGQDTNRNNIDFSIRCITPGQFNSNQTTNCPGSGVTITPTPTPTWTTTPVPTLPAGCVNILANSDMEREGSWIFGWTPAMPRYVGTVSRGGLRSLQLGIPPESADLRSPSFSSARQAVRIPGNITTAQLRWWEYTKTEEAVDENPTTRSDRQEVILLTSKGGTIRILSRVRRNNGAWQERVADLTEFNGRDLNVYFNVFNDANGSRTWMFLDDVTLDVCYPPATATPPPTPTPTITPTPTQTPTPTWTSTPTWTPTLTSTPTPTLDDGRPTPTFTPTLDDGRSGRSIAPSLLGTPLPNVVSPLVQAAPLPTSAAPSALPETAAASVVRVIDGETIEVRLDLAVSAQLAAISVAYAGRSDADIWAALPSDDTLFTVRYADIEAPPLNTVEGLAAADLNRSLVEGKTVRLLRAATDGSVTGIPSVYVFLEDGTLVNAEMVRQGYATVSADAAGGPYQDLLAQAEAEAVAAGRGIWAGGASQGYTPGAGFTLMFSESAPATQVSNADVFTPSISLPAPAPVVGPAECVELVNNGGFEAEGLGWNLIGADPQPFYTTTLHFDGGARALRLGLIDETNAQHLSAIDQFIALPDDVSNIMLSFRYVPLSEADPGPGDFQYVDIYHAATGQFAGRALGIQQGSETGAGPGSEQSDVQWLAQTYDLTALAGQPIRLVFAVNNDGVGGRSAMVVDNVSILACNLSGDLTESAAGTAGTPGAKAGATLEPTDSPPLAEAGAKALRSALAGRETTEAPESQSRLWLGRLFTAAVMLGILGIIGFAAFVIAGAFKPPSGA